MSTCLDQIPVFVASVSKGQTSLAVNVFVPSVNQPPVVAVQTCAFVLVNGNEAAAIQQASLPFDYVLAASFWVFAFSFTIGSWFLAKNLGLILEAIKRW